ncbi:MAG: Maleamate amidohydrolase [Alphaproteobacteria bacterium MarineAlpha2_Bin1]|nr:MAG: Maleamate amidohydrolase [Alphaproteobacteria bacterium MarineAlpha2_Bin1]|tara:strand:- start:97 stop:759 length:663 start_codon:yes stop_codon:yes gene_type:complete
MEESDLTPRQFYKNVKSNPNRAKFGFGKKPILVNVDLQKAYTRTDLFKTAYETDPRQLEYISNLSEICRKKNIPVVWTHVGYLDSGEDAGVWGTRTDTPDSLQNIKIGSERNKLDDRLIIDRSKDIFYLKRMPSAFFETPLQSLCVWHKIDTIIITGGSTSGCIRATCVDSLSRGYKTIIPEECVADKHEIPHFSNLVDMQLKYGDVENYEVVRNYLDNL